jgi:hypothetical protein
MTIKPQHSDHRLTDGSDLPYFVVGGRYADTSFTKLVEPGTPEGPFDRYEDAVDVWRANSMRHIDEAFVRYLIVHAATAEEAGEHAEESPGQRDVRSA